MKWRRSLAIVVARKTTQEIVIWPKRRISPNDNEITTQQQEVVNEKKHLQFKQKCFKCRQFHVD
jgi:hypothetical protein